MSRFDIIIGVLTIKTVFVVTFTVAGLEACFKRAHDLVESVGGQGLEIVFFIDVVDGDSAVHLQTMQKEQKF